VYFNIAMLAPIIGGVGGLGGWFQGFLVFFLIFSVYLHWYIHILIQYIHDTHIIHYTPLATTLA